jgi:hydroxypyruvate isomerase
VFSLRPGSRPETAARLDPAAAGRRDSNFWNSSAAVEAIVGELRQSFAWWSFTRQHGESPKLLETAARIGYRGVDFLPRSLWPQARAAGLALTVVDGHEGADRSLVGFNHRAEHARLQPEVRASIELAAASGVQGLAVAVGSRDGTPDDTAIRVCAEGLAPLAAHAEAAGVLLLLEALNSKVDHPGNQCDHTGWAAAVLKLVDSPALKLCHDVYHMQIMEGDLIRTVTENLELIAHIHTAGVPGRHELDDQQEVNYPAIARVLRDRGFAGWVAHELTPRGSPEAALRQAFSIFTAPPAV